MPSKKNIIHDAAASKSEFASLAGVSESDIMLMGRSLGGAVVIQLAAQDPPRGQITESTFSSFSDVATHHYPRLAWLVNPRKLNSAAQLPKYSGPLLQSHGSADNTIAFALGHKLFAAANEPKQFVTIPRGRHNSRQSSQYYQVFNKFIDSL